MADADVRDGGSSTKTKSLAQIGAKGTQPKNVSRDFDRLMKSQGYIAGIEPYEVSCLFRNTSGEVCEKVVPMILPHDVCHQIYSLGKMDFLTGPPMELEAYWGNVMHKTWFENHPHRTDVLRAPSKAIPFRLWGDDAVNTKQKSLYCISFASTVCLRYASLLSRFLTIAVGLGDILCLDPLFEALAWSFEILGTGILPLRRHDFAEFNTYSNAWKHRGKRVMGDFIALLCEATGDLKYLVETYHFEHNYSTDSCCFKCYACKRHGPVSAYDFVDQPAWLHSRRLHSEYMHSTGGSVAAARIPGFHLDMVSFDLMHTLHLGVLLVAIGSAFFELLELNYFGGPVTGGWGVRFSAQFRIAWEWFSAWLKRNKLSTHQAPFCVNRMSMRAFSDPPLWKGKAGENALLARFLLEHWLILAQRTSDPKHHLIAGNLWGYVRIIDIAKNPNVFLSEGEALELEEARSVAFTSHSLLSHASVAASSQLWRTVPKHHYLDHLCRPNWPDSSGGKFNPGHGWCFADEDFIGRLTRISKGRMNIKALLTKYLLRLHLLLERDSYSVPAL